MSRGGERKTRCDKKIRVNPALDQCTHQKLQRLALACGLPKTQLAAEIIELALNTTEIINFLQEIYRADAFRVIPFNENGRVSF